MKRLILLPLAAFFLSCSVDTPAPTDEFRNGSFVFISAQKLHYVKGVEVLDTMQTDSFTYLKEINRLTWKGPEETKTYAPYSQGQKSFFVVEGKDTIMFALEPIYKRMQRVNFHKEEQSYFLLEAE